MGRWVDEWVDGFVGVFDFAGQQPYLFISHKLIYSLTHKLKWR